MKNNKGITLIALVVTIIVLLILAGVSIAMLTGDNGILSRASQSSVANAVGEGKDQVALYIAELSANYYAAKYNGATVTPTYTSGQTLIEYINSAETSIEALDGDESTFKITYSEASGEGASATPASIKVEAAKDSTKYSTATIQDGKIGAWVDTNLNS